MTGSNRQRITIACAGVMAFAFPLSILVPFFNLLIAAGLAALYYLWFARATSWLVTSAALALALLWLLSDVRHVAFFVIGALVPGMILAMTRRVGWRFSMVLATACAVPLLGSAIYHETFVGFVAAFADELRGTISSPQFSQLYPPAEYERVVAYVNTWADNAPFYFPAAMMSLLAGLYAIGVLIGEVLVTRTGIYSYRIPPFTHWKLDEWMVLPIGIAAIMVLTKERIFEVIGWNALLLMFVLLSVFGLSFLEYHMRVRKFPLAVKVVIYLFLFLTQVIAAVILPLVALFDAKFDFRKIRAKQLG